MRPVVQGMAEKYGKQIRFIVADVSTSYGNNLANEYQIMYIPAMYFIDKNGQVVDSFVGTLTDEELETKLKNILK